MDYFFFRHGLDPSRSRTESSVETHNYFFCHGLPSSTWLDGFGGLNIDIEEERQRET